MELRTSVIFNYFKLIQISFFIVYGDINISFRDYIAPALVLAITYAMSVGLTALAFVQERKEGLLERSLVSGVLSIHIFFAHFIVEFVMMLLQTIIMLIFMFNVFGISMNGSLILVILLTLVQGKFYLFSYSFLFYFFIT